MGDEDDGDGEGLSFWEVGGYKRTTKRISEGNQLCTDLMEMAQERGELEAKFAGMLRSWSKKWSDKIEKGPEYGSLETAWKQALTAADRQAEVHYRVKEEITNNVLNEVKRWQKDNFHKGMMAIHLKEKKEMDEEFKKVQKPWAKKLKVVTKCKEDFHTICQKELSAENTARNQESNPSISEDQRQKQKDEVAKLGNQRQTARANYEDALKDLNSYNARYMEDMKEVYQRCQEMENRRLEFFKSRLVAMHHALDLTDDVTMRQIYSDYINGVENANAKSDLKCMPMNWPQFEEYGVNPNAVIAKSPISFSTLRGRNGNTDTISTRSIKSLDDTPTYTMKRTEEVTSTPNSTIRSNTVTISGPIPAFNGDAVSSRSIGNSRESLNRHSNSRESLSGDGEKVTVEPKGETGNIESHTMIEAKSSDANPFNEEWSENAADKGDDVHVDSKTIVNVKALFDYTGEEGDELSFKEGDVFEKLSDKDDQGWCKGRKNGVTGLFPHAYVEQV